MGSAPLAVQKQLTVKNMLQKLVLFKEDDLVVIDGYEGGLDTVVDMKNLNIEQNKNKASYYGIYEQVNDSSANNAVYLISTRNVR